MSEITQLVPYYSLNMVLFPAIPLIFAFSEYLFLPFFGGERMDWVVRFQMKLFPLDGGVWLGSYVVLAQLQDADKAFICH